MAREHSFSIGLPDNVVFCEDFLDTLQNKLDKWDVFPHSTIVRVIEEVKAEGQGFINSSVLSLQCLYCEKTFRDKTTLKDHMRKKNHRRINASNQEYDRFYVINYLVKESDSDLGFCLTSGISVDLLCCLFQELGKTWEEVQSEDDREFVEDDDE